MESGERRVRALATLVCLVENGRGRLVGRARIGAALNEQQTAVHKLHRTKPCYLFQEILISERYKIDYVKTSRTSVVSQLRIAANNCAFRSFGQLQ